MSKKNNICVAECARIFDSYLIDCKVVIFAYNNETGLR